MRRTLKARLSKLEKQSAVPRIDVLWVDIDRGETHEGVIKAKYGDQVPPDVEPITVSWMPQEIPTPRGIHTLADAESSP